MSYQQEVTKNMKEHKPLDIKQARVLNWLIGLSGETGEVAELIKHDYFGGKPLDIMELAKELGDVIWYVTALCSTYNISLDDVMKLNSAKLNHRYKDGYSQKEQQSRRTSEVDFKSTDIYSEIESRILSSFRQHKSVVEEDSLSYIFIGADGAGKTTLSKAFAEKMGVPYEKHTHISDPDALVTKFNRDVKLMQLSEDPFIWDRWHYPAEKIYPDLYIEGTMSPLFDDDTITEEELESLMLKNKVIFVYVSADDRDLKSRFIKRGDPDHNFETILKAKERYEKFIVGVSIPIIYVNTSQWFRQEDIIEALRNKHEEIAFFGYSNYINITEEL